MAENLYPEWMQAACQRCREGLPMRDGEVGCHVRAGQSEWVLRYPECTAPTPERHIKDLTAKLDTTNEVIRQIAQMFGIKDVRHILGDLQAQFQMTERKARALDGLSLLCQSGAVGNGVAIFPITQNSEKRISVMELGDDDGSGMGDELSVEITLLEAIEAAMKEPSHD